jgi:hypothetical protein
LLSCFGKENYIRTEIMHKVNELLNCPGLP